MSEITLVIRTADLSRKAEISVPAESSANEIIQAAVDNWSLPKDTDYTIVNTNTKKALGPSDVIGKSTSSGDILEIQPVLVAGAIL